MRIEVRSRQNVSSHDGIENGSSVAIISISDPNDDHPFVVEWPELREVLRLSFHDIDRQWFADINKEVPEKYTLMKDDDAFAVAEFVEKHKDVDLLIVQCEAGISRSSGMAAAILKHQTGDDSQIFESKRYVPNMFVYNRVLRALRESMGKKLPGPASPQWSDAKNHRRCELVDKEIGGAISPTERSELDQLQSEMLTHRQNVAPLPLEGLRELHQELLRRSQEQAE